MPASLPTRVSPDIRSAGRYLRRLWIEASWVLIYCAMFFTSLCWAVATYLPDDPIRVVEMWRMAWAACLMAALFVWGAGLPFRIQHWR